VLQNALRSDDDAIAEPVSALGIGEHGWVQGLDFVVFFALMLAFAVGLPRGIRPSRLGWLGPMLFVVAAVGLFVAAAFPLARDADGEIYDPSHHELGGLLFFMSSSLALIAISREPRPVRRSPRPPARDDPMAPAAGGEATSASSHGSGRHPPVA
jgi:hypothetical protein